MKSFLDLLLLFVVSLLMGSAEGFRVGHRVVVSNDTGPQKEKPQTLKQKNSSNCRRGDKRNIKVQKSRCDSFSLKNGLVGFNSGVGGSNFFGLYGLKPDAFDITKYVNELSIDDLLHGHHKSSDIIAKDTEKKTDAKTNNNLLQSVRKACAILQTPKLLQTQKCAEIDIHCSEKNSMGSASSSSAANQSNGDNSESCSADLPSPHKVQESADKIKEHFVANPRIYQPKDILQRLSLPPPKDLDLLLCDASKATRYSLALMDPRSSKTVSHRTGLPPFSWSHSFSGHNKLGADAGKLSATKTTCNGRWAKVRDCSVMQKGSADLLVEFESLTFDHSLIPEVKSHPEHSIDRIDRFLLSSAACSTVNVPGDMPSPTYDAAQTLCDMATVALNKNPSSAMTMKACKLKPTEKSDRIFDVARSSTRPQNDVGYNWFPSKKLKLSTDVPNVQNGYSASPRKEPTQLFKPPPPRKLFRAPNANTYNIDLMKTSYLVKPPRTVDKLSSGSSSSSSQQKKLKKVVPMQWSRPES